MTSVRDRFWLWGHEAGSHTGAEWGLPEPSRITPAEAAAWLGVPNLILVRYGGRPAPPYRQYAVPFRALRRVVWSIVGAGGATQDAELGDVLALRPDLPNLAGVMMDDFFRDPAAAGPMSALTIEQVRGVRATLASAAPPLDLWVVVYRSQLDLPIGGYLALCEKVTYWTWRAADLVHLERDFAALEALAPNCGKLLGCYMWDYGTHAPMPTEAMQYQCELGLRWLRAGRIEGLVFLASCICDLGLDAVEWTRRWIAEVGDRPLNGRW